MKKENEKLGSSDKQIKEPKLEDFYDSLDPKGPTTHEYNRFINAHNNWKLKIKKQIDSTQISRVEVIDENGRSYVKYFDVGKLDFSIQDEGRTLKLFIN